MEMLADLEDDEAKDTARKLGKFTAEILLVVIAEKGITKATTALKESAKSGKLNKVGNAWVKTKEKADDFVDDLVKGNIVTVSEVSKIPNKGFNTFNKLKNYLGKADDGYAWHHIVEQSQISKAGFVPEQIHNVRNVVQIPSGYSGSVHSEISKIYSSKQIYSEGLTVRDWLSTKSFEEQFEFGLDMLKDYGTVVATETGWIFTPFN